MKKLLILLFPCMAFSQNDSIHVQDLLLRESKTHVVVFAGISSNSYLSKRFYMSSPPVGYRAGIGLTRSVNRKYEVIGNIWYQNTQFNNITTEIFNSYYREQVTLKTSVNLKQVYFGAELNRRFAKISFGLNAGLNYLIKANTTQDIYTTATDSIKKINIYYQYMVYDFMKDSYQNGIAPYGGLQFCYYPVKWLGIKYSNNLILSATPWKKYQFYKSVYPFLHCLTLNLNI